MTDLLRSGCGRTGLRLNRNRIDHIGIAVGAQVWIQVPSVSFVWIDYRLNLFVHAKTKRSESGSRIWKPSVDVGVEDKGEHNGFQDAPPITA